MGRMNDKKTKPAVSPWLQSAVEKFDAALAVIKNERVVSTRVGNARMFGSGSVDTQPKPATTR